jgi:hypothetical protein
LNIPLIKNQTRKIKMSTIGDMLISGQGQYQDPTTVSIGGGVGSNPYGALPAGLDYASGQSYQAAPGLVGYTGAGGNINAGYLDTSTPTGVLGESVTKTPAQIAAEQQASARGNRQSGISSIYGSANDAATNLQGSFANSVQDNLRVLQQGQQGIDLKAQNNEASRAQGINGILGMVGRGIQSGGRYLGNRNAGSSSAAGEIARAYGDIGRRQMSSVGNQYEQNNQQILLDQGNQDYNVGKTKRDFTQSLNQSVNSIVESARTELANLDAQSANASLPDRIAIEQEKQNIKNQVMAKLQQYDAQLASGADSIKARGREGNMAAATQQLEAGQAPANSFQYTDQTPGQFQNTGPFSSGLPIFINPNRRQIA